MGSQSREHPGLEPDEELLVHTPASFRGAMATSISSTIALGPARKRLEAYNAWRMQADVAGFETAGPEMVLGLTDRRLVIWKTTFWFSRRADRRRLASARGRGRGGRRG